MKCEARLGRLCFFFFFKDLYLRIYSWLCWIFFAAWAFFSLSERGPLPRHGVQASPGGGFSCYRARALGT